MSDVIKALNPAMPINSEADAVAAARASAVSIFIGVVWGAIGLYMMMNGGQEAMKAAMEASPETAGMGDMMIQGALYMGVGIVVIQLVVGLVQWFKPNMIIPILWMVLVVFGLGSTVLGLVTAGSVDIPEEARGPAWQSWANMAVLAVQFVLHVSGIRGGSALGKFRQAG